jgi:PleD family two-component response regulator
MTKPLALVFYENLLPGSQLMNRLQDLGYRVIAFHDSYLLEDQSEREKPLVVIADVTSRKTDVCGAIKKLRENPATQHIPVLAFASAGNEEIMAKARESGANLVADAAGISDQLPQLLEAVLQVE